MDRRRKDTKEKIITATRKYIERNGSSRISIRRIATELGISSAAFYNHFNSKDDLLNAVFAAASIESFYSYRAKYPSNLTDTEPVEQLTILGEYILDEFILRPYLMEFLMFSPYALSAFSRNDSYQGNSHHLLGEAYRLIGLIKDEYQLSSEAITLYIKCWSFFQGYAMLVSSNIIVHEKRLIRETICDIISGDYSRREQTSTG